MEQSGIRTFFAGRKKLIVVVVVFVIGLIFLLSNVEENPPNVPQDIVKQQEKVKPDVAGAQADPSSAPVSTNEPTPNTDSRQIATLVKVVDGDTIAVSINGKSKTIRIIGIDTPEVVDKRKTVECFGKEASDFANLTLQDNRNLLLESDPTQGERDKYNRLLRYVWIDDGEMDFGKFMIGDGYASEYTYNLPYKYQNEYKQAEKKAREAKRGLWADGVCLESAGTNADQTVEVSPTSQKQPIIDSSGGDKDCSDFATHAEAQDYFQSKGGSPTNNVDKLDSDHDGLACESLP